MSRRKQSKPKAVKDEQAQIAESTIIECMDDDDGYDDEEPQMKRSRDTSYNDDSSSITHNISEDKSRSSRSSTEMNDVDSDDKSQHSILFMPQPVRATADSMKCQFCMEVFGSISSLQLHTLRQHVTSIIDERIHSISSDSPDDPSATSTTRFLECQHCSAVFPHLAAFALHMRQHISSDSGSDLLRLSSISNNQSAADATDLSSTITHKMTSIDDIAPCSLCSKTFTDNLARLSHIITHYEIIMRRHLCMECHTIFPTSADLLQHSIDRHLAVQYICTICNYAVDNQKSYQEHCMEHSKEAISYKCNSCPLSFEAREMLAIHVQYVHDNYRDVNLYETQAFAIRTSSLLRSQQQSVINHFSAADHQLLAEKSLEKNLRSLQCSVCDESCSGEDALDEHRLFSHCKVLQSEYCAECAAPLRNSEDFEHHTRLHVHDMYMSCAVCRQSLRSESQLKLHCKFHMMTHKLSMQPPFMITSPEKLEEKRCAICSKTLISNNQLLLHLLEHDDQKCCPYCNLKFTLAHLLLNHLSQEHNKEKALFACEICAEVYHFQIQLEHHKMSHAVDIDNSESPESNWLIGSQNDKPNSLLDVSPKNSKDSFMRKRCPVCSLSFNKGTRYDNHIKKHMNTNCCACQICGESFARRDELEQHMMVHKGNLENGSRTQPKD